MEQLQALLLTHANACHAMLEALDSGLRAKSEAEAKAALDAFLELVRALDHCTEESIDDDTWIEPDHGQCFIPD